MKPQKTCHQFFIFLFHLFFFSSIQSLILLDAKSISAQSRSSIFPSSIDSTGSDKSLLDLGFPEEKIQNLMSRRRYSEAIKLAENYLTENEAKLKLDQISLLAVYKEMMILYQKSGMNREASDYMNKIMNLSKNIIRGNPELIKSQAILKDLLSGITKECLPEIGITCIQKIGEILEPEQSEALKNMDISRMTSIFPTCVDEIARDLPKKENRIQTKALLGLFDNILLSDDISKTWSNISQKCNVNSDGNEIFQLVEQRFLSLIRKTKDNSSNENVMPNFLKTFMSMQQFAYRIFISEGSEAEMMGRTNLIQPYESFFLSTLFSGDNSDIDYSSLALNLILNKKGRILFLMSSKRTDILNDQEPVNKKNLDELKTVNNMLASVTFNPSFNQFSEQEKRDLVEKLEIHASNLEALIYTRNEDFKSLKSEFTNITIDSVQKELPKDTALVEFIVYQPTTSKKSNIKDFLPIPASRYAACILFPDGKIHWFDLGPTQSIDQSFATLRDNLRDRKTPILQVKQSARKLDELIMQPIRQKLGNIRNIFLSPDSTLNLLSFETLVDEKDRYLLETYNITYLTSGRDLLRKRNPKPNNNPPLILADPFFDKPGKVNVTKTNRIRTLYQNTWQPLKGTAEEAKAIASLVGTQPLLGSDATETAVKEAKNSIIIHIATHGFFQIGTDPNQNPLLNSGLVFAGVKVGKSGSDDGILTALEVSNLNLTNTKLVTLSACDTGLGTTSNGEGIYGLRRALVIAGAESQVISLWKVADDATKDLMINYYTRLNTNEGRSFALHEAQRDMLKSEKYAHPYYWAAFIPSGDWRPINPSKPEK
jgi:CHAT domain-containing protein